VTLLVVRRRSASPGVRPATLRIRPAIRRTRPVPWTMRPAIRETRTPRNETRTPRNETRPVLDALLSRKNASLRATGGDSHLTVGSSKIAGRIDKPEISDEFLAGRVSEIAGHVSKITGRVSRSIETQQTTLTSSARRPPSRPRGLGSPAQATSSRASGARSDRKSTAEHEKDHFFGHEIFLDRSEWRERLSWREQPRSRDNRPIRENRWVSPKGNTTWHSE
jgi:hypothetical protein